LPIYNPPPGPFTLGTNGSVVEAVGRDDWNLKPGERVVLSSHFVACDNVERNRSTLAERALQTRTLKFHLGPGPVRVRRMLERPIGFVRWKDATPDRPTAEVEVVASGP
jgi:threonine dehydrogenase-like Zn-dependent dehydrogenase